MSGRHFVANGILWGAAIVASAIAGAPPFFSTLLLPAFAAGALVVTCPRSRPSA